MSTWYVAEGFICFMKVPSVNKLFLTGPKTQHIKSVLFMFVPSMF